MAIVERSQETKASPQSVWRIWSDVSTWKDWNPNVRSMSLNGPFASGTTGTMVTGQAQHAITLEEVMPGKSFRLETTVVPLTRFSFECAITPGSGGMTTISQGIRVKGPLGGIIGPMMGRQVAASFPALLKGLATTAEASEART